jgi:hypothetical protein
MTKRERCFCSTARPSFEHQLDELVLKQELERRRLSIFAVSSRRRLRKRSAPSERRFRRLYASCNDRKQAGNVVPRPFWLCSKSFNANAITFKTCRRWAIRLSHPAAFDSIVATLPARLPLRDATVKIKRIRTRTTNFQKTIARQTSRDLLV